MNDETVLLIEASALQTAREKIEKMIVHVEEAASATPRDGLFAIHDAMNLGRVAQALEEAERALTRALIIALSYGHCAESKRVFDASCADEETASVPA